MTWDDSGHAAYNSCPDWLPPIVKDFA